MVRQTLARISKKKEKKKPLSQEFFSVVLLHAGAVGRTKNKKPVGLIKFGNMCLLDHQIKAIKSKFKNCEIIISVSCGARETRQHLLEKHKNKNIRVIENTQPNSTNSCETARLCLNNINNDRIIFIDGSLSFDRKIFNKMDFSKSFAILNTYEEESLEIRVNANGSKVEFFCYGANTPWSEIIFLNGMETINDLSLILEHEEFRKKIFFEAINIITSKHQISQKMNSEKVAKIKNLKTYNKVRRMYEIRD